MHSLLPKFGLSSFRPLQESIISNVLAGHNTLAILPTGAGKSLTAQLPALLLPGLSLVISPLIALMRDQVDSLNSLGIPAARLDSSLTPDDRASFWRNLDSSRTQLLYLAPESLHLPETLDQLQQRQISLITIDEAHCLSEWGPKFRPDYLQLPKTTRLLNPHAILLLTATATPRVAADLQAMFNIAPAFSIRLPVAKPNIRRLADHCPQHLLPSRIADFLAPPQNRPAIVYVPTRKDADNLAAAISSAARASGFSAKSYHAGYDAITRATIQSEFQNSSSLVLVATIAFGMGIDKPDIRTVIHASLPASPEAYIQESGRAGRDLLPAQSLVLLGEHDLSRLTSRAISSIPSLDSISSWLFSILRDAPSSVQISPYLTAQAFDISPTILDQLCLILENLAILSPLPPTFLNASAKPLRPLRLLLSQSDPDFSKLLWLSELPASKPFPISSAASAWNCSHQQALDFLSDLANSGDWKIAFSHQLLQFATRPVPDIPALASQLHTPIQSLLHSDLARLAQMRDIFLNPNTCLSSSLASFFGDPIPDSPCGFCPACSQTPVTLPDPQLPDPTPAQLELLRELKARRLTALSSPHRLARFLAGIYFTSLPIHLTRHELYGAFPNHPWPSLLAYASC